MIAGAFLMFLLTRTPASPLSLTIGDDPNRPFRRILNKLPRLIVQFDLFDTQFSRTPDSRKERSKNDRQDKERRDFDTFGSLVNVLNRRVNKDRARSIR